MTNLSAATPSNPSNLPARYEIRQLTMEHLPFVRAIMAHSNMFCSPVWPLCYPENKTERLLKSFRGTDYLARHQIESGYSFGVFDLEYRFKRDESKPDGKLCWDVYDVGASADDLLEQMDFPLMASMVEIIPLFPSIYHYLAQGDTRDDSWKPTGPKQVLMRNSTSTRHDAEGRGLMRKLAEFLMRHAAEQGFRAINMECLQDKVTKVWSTPPSPFKSTIVSEFRVEDIEEEREVEGGGTVKVRPFAPAVQRATKIFVDLKPHAAANGHVPHIP